MVDFILFGIRNSFMDHLDSSVDLRSGTTDEDLVLIQLLAAHTKFDGDKLVLANNTGYRAVSNPRSQKLRCLCNETSPVKSHSVFASDGGVPFPFDRDGFALDIRDCFDEGLDGLSGFVAPTDFADGVGITAVVIVQNDQCSRSGPLRREGNDHVLVGLKFLKSRGEQSIKKAVGEPKRLCVRFAVLALQDLENDRVDFNALKTIRDSGSFLFQLTDGSLDRCLISNELQSDIATFLALGDSRRMEGEGSVLRFDIADSATANEILQNGDALVQVMSADQPRVRMSLLGFL